MALGYYVLWKTALLLISLMIAKVTFSNVSFKGARYYKQENPLMTTPPNGDIQVYKAADGGVRFEVRLERETVWLTQRQMAELFDTSTDNVGLHQKKYFCRQ